MPKAATVYTDALGMRRKALRATSKRRYRANKGIAAKAVDAPSSPLDRAPGNVLVSYPGGGDFLSIVHPLSTVTIFCDSIVVNNSVAAGGAGGGDCAPEYVCLMV